MAKQQNPGGGKKGRKIGRNKEKCAAYRGAHHIDAAKKRFYSSREHRGCGPLHYYTRKNDLEYKAVQLIHDDPTICLHDARLIVGLK